MLLNAQKPRKDKKEKRKAEFVNSQVFIINFPQADSFPLPNDIFLFTHFGITIRKNIFHKSRDKHTRRSKSINIGNIANRTLFTTRSIFTVGHD